MLLNICYRLEISFLDFLNTDNLYNNSYTKTLHRYLISSHTPRTPQKSFDSNRGKDFLLAVLASEEDRPRTMKEVSIRIGYDKRTINC
jgi:hypothetical protein